MSRVGWIVVVATVLVSACGEKKESGSTGTSGGSTTETRAETPAPGVAPSPAVGSSAGTATSNDGGAMTMAPTGTTAGSTGMTGTSAQGSASSAAASAPDAGSMANSKDSMKGAAFTDADRKQAQEIYASRCTPCHGPSGKGDGAAAVALNPKPRNFGDAAWQTSVTDEHIEKIISMGGASVGKSPLMPPNPDIAGKPVVKALREYVRNFGQKAAK